MKLTNLRKRRDELIEVLSDLDNEDGFDPVTMIDLENCARGHGLDSFKKTYTEDVSEDEDPEPSLVWDTEYHQEFYDCCRKIAKLEHSEYKKAMGRV